MPDIPDPNDPTDVVPMDTPTSPEWAQQERWKEVIRKACVPCKEHGIYPVLGEQFLALSRNPLLAIGKMTVHCPNKECKFYAEDYNPAKWNELMR
jgi:hypothetical protein